MNAKIYLFVLLCLLLATTLAYAETYTINSSGFKLGPTYNITYNVQHVVITYGELAHVNVTKKGITLQPKYTIPSYTRYFNGSCSTCQGLCVLKQKARPEFGYSCVSTIGLPSSGFSGWTITAHYITNDTW